jgi:hypothetical protein
VDMAVVTQLYLGYYYKFQLHVLAIVELAIVKLKINYRRKQYKTKQSGAIYMKRGGRT